MRLALCTLFLAFLAAPAAVALPVGVVEALRPVDGVVIKVAGAEYLLDIGSSDGLREGDLVAVLAPAEELAHPTSGAVVGRIERARALLRVVRTQPEFCWARLLPPTADVKPTEAVRRFAEVPALFVDRRGDGHPLLTELQQALPHLAWRPWGETAPAGPGVLFLLDGTTLSLRDDRGALLGTWPVPAASAVPAAAVVPPAPVPAAAAAPPLLPLPVKFQGKASGVAIADSDGDGAAEVAVALETHIEIGRVAKQSWQPVARIDLPGMLRILTLDSADLDGDGRAELLVTAVRGSQLAAQVWGWDGSRYRQLAGDLPWYWRALDWPESAAVVVGQSGDDFTRGGYGGKPFRVSWQHGRPVPGEAIDAFAAPTLHGSQPFRDGTTTLWARLDSDDRLLVAATDGTVLWRSSVPYGGGESFVEWPPKRARDELRRVFVRSRLALADGLLLVPQNQGSRLLGNQRKAELSRLVALRWNGLELEEVWSTPPRDGYLADFAGADLDGDGRQEFLLAGTLASGPFGGTQSALFLWQPR